MRKNVTRIITGIMTILMLLVVMQVSVFAEKVTIKHSYIKTKDGLYQWEADTDMGIKDSAATLKTRELDKGYVYQWYQTENSVKSLKSSDTKVATVKDYKGYAYKIKIKKAGKVTVSYSCKQYEKTLNVKDIYTIYDYKNPIKSFKIGSKEFASGFKSSPFNPSKKNYSGKLSVKLNSGWKLIKLRQAPGGSTLMSLYANNFKSLKNGSKVSTKKGAIEAIVYNKSKKYYTSVIFGASPASNLIYG